MMILTLLALIGCNGDDIVDTGEETTQTGTETPTGPPPDSEAFGHYNPSCNPVVASFGGADRHGSWFATRIIPPSTPFVLTGAEVTVTHGERDGGLPPCDAGSSFEVRLVVSSDNAPPDGDGSAPSFDEAVTFPAELITVQQDRVLDFEVDPPIEVQAGESVFLAIQTHYYEEVGGNEDEVTCVVACEGTNSDDFFTYEVDPEDWDWSAYPPADLWMQIWGYAD